MRDLDEANVTDAVIETFAKAADPRFKEIMTALARHLHQFARETELTPEEWIAAIQFLTRVGQTCSATRQEFILLSDTLGLSALVDAMNSRDAKGATASSLLGPFFRENAPVFKLGDNIAKNAPGEVILISGQVRDTDGNPIAKARLDVWQTASDGLYDIQSANPAEMNFRGRFQTDDRGRYHYRTVVPLGYSIPTDGPVGDMIRGLGRHGFRPAHLHFLIGAEGHRELATALYLAGDEHIESDAVFGVSSSLVVEIQKAAQDGTAPGLRRILYDFTLMRESAGAKSRRVGADPATVGRAAE